VRADIAGQCLGKCRTLNGIQRFDPSAQARIREHRYGIVTRRFDPAGYRQPFTRQQRMQFEYGESAVARIQQ
jgi:hypothetical protein